MRKPNHSPAYVMEIKGRWRVVVPISGRLTPRLCPEGFPSRASAEEWLRSEEGTCVVAIQRGDGPERGSPASVSERYSAGPT